MSDWTIDEEYVRRLIAGDYEVEQHFTGHFTVIMRIKLRSKLHSYQLIEDIRQETFLRVFKSLRTSDRVNSLQNLGAFVHGVCNNVMLETLRDHTRQGQIPEDLPESMDEHDDPAENLLTSERKRLVQDVLADLSKKDREIIRQVFFEERDKDRICRKMNVTPEYLRVLVHRAKNRFRAIYEKRDA